MKCSKAYMVRFLLNLTFSLLCVIGGGSLCMLLFPTDIFDDFKPLWLPLALACSLAHLLSYRFLLLLNHDIFNLSLFHPMDQTSILENLGMTNFLCLGIWSFLYWVWGYKVVLEDMLYVSSYWIRKTIYAYWMIFIGYFIIIISVSVDCWKLSHTCSDRRIRMNRTSESTSPRPEPEAVQTEERCGHSTLAAHDRKDCLQHIKLVLTEAWKGNTFFRITFVMRVLLHIALNLFLVIYVGFVLYLQSPSYSYIVIYLCGVSLHLYMLQILLFVNTSLLSWIPFFRFHRIQSIDTINFANILCLLIWPILYFIMADGSSILSPDISYFYTHMLGFFLTATIGVLYRRGLVKLGQRNQKGF